MVLPEGTPPSDGNRPRILVAVGVALVLLLAMIALGLATAPTEEVARESNTTTTAEPLLEPTTTTTIDYESFSVSDIATGERLSWREAPSIGNRWPIELVEHQGRMYLFTSESDPGLRGLFKGMSTWVSDDGIQWEHIGGVTGTDHVMTSVNSTGGDLIALGHHIEDGSPGLWISSNGEEWSRSDTPSAQLEAGSPTVTRLTDVARLGDRLIVTGSAHYDWGRAIFDHLPSELAGLAGRYGLGLSNGPEGRVIEVHGPIGIVGYSATLEELGIDDEMANRYFHGSPTEKSFVWTTSDGNSWTTIELENSFINELWPLADGTLVASGWSNSGPSVWLSTDEGVSWEREGLYQTVVAAEWNGSLVATANNTEIIRSVDGHNWESLGTELILPAAINWHVDRLTVGPGGIAAIATAWLPRTQDPATEARVRVEEYTLSLNQGLDELTVEHGPSERVVTISLWSHQESDSVTVDFAGEEVTFFDPETDGEMLTVDFDTLYELEIASYGGPDFGEQALLVRNASDKWRIFDVDEEIGDLEWIAMMRIIGDRLILITYPRDPWPARDAPEISIRVATLR